ncbi:MAG: DUF975 family protein [Oscillospiraceae bacterium]|nr:DUF975 family protein [Oscillospiraceae bacterium]
MWTRARIKQEAKNSFKRFGYWMPFLISLITVFVTNGFGAGSGASSSATATTEYSFEHGSELSPAGFVHFFEEFLGEFGAAVENFFTNPLIAMTTAFILVMAFVFGIVISFGWGAFIAGPITVGAHRYFMEHRAFGSKFEKIFFAFHSGRYLNVVKICFVMNVKIFLWSLLFIIPGIIKSYEYSMIPYILAENPQISMERAFEISRKMTKGEKWKIFVLEISFWGWYLLGAICCCVGGIFVHPYYFATFAELYQVMREKAHGLGFADYADLPGFFPDER